VETKASSEQTLILKRDPDAVQSEHYDVLFEGRYVGRIGAPKDAPWFWGLIPRVARATMGRNMATSPIWKLQNRLPRRVGSEPEGDRKK